MLRAPLLYMLIHFPDAGRYLPVLAALGGILRLHPREWEKRGPIYSPAQHDVVS